MTASVATWARAAAGWAATRSLQLARFGDNMRYVAVTEGDKTEAEASSASRSTPRASTTWSPRWTRAQDGSTSWSRSTRTATTSRPSCARGGDRHESLRDGAAIELGLRSFLDGGGFGAFTTSFEDLGGLRQLPGLAVQRLMADGYGFGGEGDWKTAVLVRAVKVMGAGLPGGASFMEDYTYDLTPGEELILGAHMLEVCPTLISARPRLEIHPLSIGGREDPVRLVFDAARAPASSSPSRTSATGSVWSSTRWRSSPRRPLPKLPVGRALWRPAADLSTSAKAWLTAAGPTTPR